MRNLLLFIAKYSHLLLFVGLEVVAFLLIGSRSAYPKSTFLTAANSVVASVNQAADNVVGYFHLRSDNDKLNAEICRLNRQIMDLQNELEPIREQVPDTVTDSLTYSIYRYAHLCYTLMPAKVIDISTQNEHNYLTLNKGADDGLEVGMGVICNQGIVGVVSQVSPRFALVVPIIHTQTNISCRIKKNGYICFTHWNGQGSRYVNLQEVARHVDVSEGDTIVTSGMTHTFPEGMFIGTVDKAVLRPTDNHYRIRLRLGTDFHRIRYVQVLKYNNPDSTLDHE